MATLTQQFPYMEHKGTLTVDGLTFEVYLKEIQVEETINDAYAIDWTYRRAVERKRIFIVEEIEL